MASADQPAGAMPNLDSTSLDTESLQLPHIPTELLLLIIDHVPATYILLFRSVCRSTKEHIDNFILKSYLQRMTIIGYEPFLEPSALDEGLSTEVARALPFVKFQYSHLDDAPKDPIVQDGAVFKIDPEWLAMSKPWFDSVTSDQDGSEEGQYLLEPVLDFWERKGPAITKGPAGFIQLDNIALPLGFGSTQVDDSFGHEYVHVWSLGQIYLNREAMTITVNWMLVLRNMLVMEAEIIRRVHAHERNNSDFIEDESGNLGQPLVPRFTYGPLEDHIRATSREYNWRYCFIRGSTHEKEIWHPLNRHKDLFGRPREGTEEKFYAEDRLMASIMELRRGA